MIESACLVAPVQQRRERPGKHRQRQPDEQKQRDRVLEEQVGEGKPVVLVQDRQRKRQRRMVSDELDPPRLLDVMPPEVHGRNREDRQGDDPEAASAHRLLPREQEQDRREKRKPDGQEPQGRW